MPGPVPARSDQRRRRNKPETPVTKVETSAEVIEQPEPDPRWHPMARDWYLSLAKSGQAMFYEASDWQQARIWTEVLSRQLQQERISAVMISAWSAGATELLTTEGARRRMRVELERASSDEDEDAALAAVAGYVGLVS